MSVEYLPANGATFVMAKLGPWAETGQDELDAAAQYQKCGVLLSPGYHYHMPSPYVGWFRVSFATDNETLIKAIAGIRKVYKQNGGASS